MAQTTKKAIDERLLTHHPAGRECLDVCQSNGWHPTSADVLRLVKLWDEVKHGQRSEIAISPTRLEFARWLYRQGKINENTPSAPYAGDDADWRIAA